MSTAKTGRVLTGIKRKILIVEDNEINREILKSFLEDEYDFLEAENGEEGIRLLSQNYENLSLVILDVYMPVCSGFEFLERTQSDPLLSSVPVIVATGSDKQEDEEKCLKLGASDFVSKPYVTNVVQARVHNIIKLRESIATLSEVEYDELTGLYTLPTFCHHVNEILTADPSGEYHLAVINLEEFKLVNSVFGEKTGDRVLRYVADCQRNMLPDVPMARQGDKFYILYVSEDIPEDTDIAGIIKQVCAAAPVPNLIFRLGVIKDVERNVSPRILCDRAVMTAATIRHNFASYVAYYDSEIQQKMLEEQQMESVFEEALAGGEFVAWYQPKVDTASGKVIAAEALVRWITKDGKFMSPGAFIPVFERDGLVSRLDEEIFRRVCGFLRDRIRDGRPVVPVSVNLSRNSIYSPDVVERYAGIVDEAGISRALVPIELTESASIEGKAVSGLIDHFIAAGFSVHMDDFGTGYSSLSSLASMSFDVIKLDKSLTDRIGDKKGNIVIRHIVTIAKELGMKTVSEGVESREQVDFLKEVGCDMIQGYFFSPPKKEEIFGEILDHPEKSLPL